MSTRTFYVQNTRSPHRRASEVESTPLQMEIANKLGISIEADDTFDMVAAKIVEAVAKAIGEIPRPVSEHQLGKAAELGIDITDCATSWTAFVRINMALDNAHPKPISGATI